LDSLTALPYIQGERLLDVGSGAGLPGVPLAIARPDLDVVLMDRAERRVRFLDQVRIQLELANVHVKLGELSERSTFDAPFDADAPFDTIVARAVASADQMWALCHRHLALRGRLLCFLSTQSSGLATQGGGCARDLDDDGRFRAHLIEVKVPGLDQPHEILSLERP
jgi:16S rRNA (guanine(527)-N(7))-methyltransferase RsmG